MPPRIKVLGVEDYDGFGKGPHFANLIKPELFAYFTRVREGKILSKMIPLKTSSSFK